MVTTKKLEENSQLGTAIKSPPYKPESISQNNFYHCTGIVQASVSNQLAAPALSTAFMAYKVLFKNQCIIMNSTGNSS
jgi:hypothetical protein